MASRIVYATCVFCVTDSEASTVPHATWAAMSDSARKEYAEEHHWIVGKLDRLERHLATCPNASEDARSIGQRLISARATRGPTSRAGNVASSSSLDDDGGASSSPSPVHLPMYGSRLASRPKEELLWLQTARSLARRAGDRITALRASSSEERDSLGVTEKSGSPDLVTNADRIAQRIIFDGILTELPHHRRIGEEDARSHQPLDDQPTWIVDSIDGTTNFVHGLPDVSVCIALSVKQQIVLGVVYNPFRNEMFHAVRGRGAFLNDRQIHVSSTPVLSKAVVVCEWGYERSPAGIDTMLAGVRRLMLANVRAIRQIGSGALDMCYVACGRIDAVYTGLAGEGWKIWDYAAASVIAEEAGARITNLDGQPFTFTSKSMACTTPGISDDIVAVLRP